MYILSNNLNVKVNVNIKQYYKYGVDLESTSFKHS